MWVDTLLVSLVIGLFILFSKENQSEYYSAFWVESIPIFWALAYLFLSS